MSETHVRYFTMELDPAFTWAMVGVVVTLVHYMVINFMGGKHRRAHFSAEFMASKFNEQHRAAFQQDAPKGGYPDCGNGLYSMELSYKYTFFWGGHSARPMVRPRGAGLGYCCAYRQWYCERPLLVSGPAHYGLAQVQQALATAPRHLCLIFNYQKFNG